MENNNYLFIDSRNRQKFRWHAEQPFLHAILQEIIFWNFDDKP